MTSPVRVCGVYRKLVAGSMPPSSSSSRASAASATVRCVGVVGDAGVVVGVGVLVAAVARDRRRPLAASSPSAAAAACLSPPFPVLRLVAGAMIEVFLSAARLDRQVGQERAEREGPGAHNGSL